MLLPSKFRAIQLVLLLTAEYIAPTLLVNGAPTHGDGTQVQSGQSIQAAILAAQPGDRIVVATGTYAEQLTIDKDGITLIGKGAVLVPPASTTQNTCSGLAGPDTEAGICVTGSGVQLEPYIQEHRKFISVDRPVQGVTVTGFQVRGFSGENIAVVGAENAQVTGNWLNDGDAYGLLAVGSKSSLLAGNAVASSDKLRFIAICNDDLANVHVTHNSVSGYDIGLCIQTPGAAVEQNDVSNCCVGAFIDPGVNGAELSHNHFGATNPKCATDFSGAAGIIISGALNSEVQGNVIEGQHNGGIGVGIYVTDDQTTDPVSIASGNVIADNILYDNDVDIFLNTTGTGNVVTNNKCSTVPEYCS